MMNAQRAAARMLKRAQALGLTTKSGTPVVVDLMEELLAAASGFRNAHAWRASLKESVASAEGAQEPPALELVNPQESGNDYRLVNGRGCWVEVNGYLAHLYLAPDNSGFTVDLHGTSEAFDPVTTATMTKEDLEAVQAKAEDGVQLQLSALEDLGVEVLEDTDQPGLWVWTAPTDGGCDSSFASKVAAVDDAWAVAGRSVCGMKDMTTEQWNSLSLQAQCRLVRELADA